jgi:hypothetical protein
MLFAIALLDENARDEQLEAMRQMMIESRAIADAAEQDYLEYKEVLACLRELEEGCSTLHGHGAEGYTSIGRTWRLGLRQTVPEVTEAAGCSRRCPYCSGNCPHR